MKDKNNFQNYRALGVIMSAGMTMAASVTVGYLLGNWLDERIGTKPWLTLLFFLIGTAAGLKSLYNLAFPEKKDKED